jgi:dolichol-phosphate mannosyltransferase
MKRRILPVLYERLQNTLQSMEVSYEIVFVNDGSEDASLEIIKKWAEQERPVKYISFSRNFGHQQAIYAGTINANGQAIVSIDGDLQDPPELIPDLYEKYKQGYKVVYAKRRSRKGVNVFKRTAYKLFYRLITRITSTPIPLDTGDFRIIHREVAEDLKHMPEHDKFLRGLIAWLGYKQTSLEYDRDERYRGDPGYTFRKLVKLALDGITSFSTAPLKFATILGLLVSLFSFMLMAWVIFMKFYDPNYEIKGWYSLMVSVLFIGGSQLITIGVIGEYISRINNNVRQRPFFVIEETNLSQVKKYD